MALFSTIAMATRGRIIPAGVRKTLALASVGWILVGGVIPPPPTPTTASAQQFVSTKQGGKYHDAEKIRIERILQDDDEILTIIKFYFRCL